VTDTAWREAGDHKPWTIALVLVVAVGFLLRSWNLGSGIPYAVGIDEPAIMTTVVRILKSGSFNPHFFEYPTGYVYVQLGAAVVQFLVGAMQHSWKAVEQVGPSDFYLWGRFVTATIGAATIALVHQVGLRWGTRHALVAAGLLAVMPMHVRESHFVLTDVPLTFSVTLTLLLSLRASEKPALKAFVLAGVAAGLAAGIKYNGLVAVLMPLAAVFAIGARGPSRVAAALATATACVAAFFVTTPFALIDLPAFLNGFGIQAAAFTARQPSAEASWLVYAKHLRLAFGWPASALVVAGLGLAAFRSFVGPTRVRWVLVLVFPAVYFYVITGWSLLFARYALPMVPFLAIWAAIATMGVIELLYRARIRSAVRATAVAVVVLAALIPATIGSLMWVRDHGVETTQALAWKWIRSSVWRDEPIVSEARGLDLPAEWYRAEIVRSVARRTPEAMEAAGVRWVILSSDAWKSRTDAERRGLAPPAAYAPLMSRAQEVKVIVASDANPGPEIHILRLARQ
jgi:4-amino-4-deoxy-L-arabinose transferase-like glycosyltransferase